MLPTDLSGMPVSLPRQHVNAWDQIIVGILSHAASTGPNLQALLALQPDFALGQAIRGFACILLGRAEMTVVAREAWEAAQQAAPGTSRESDFILALGDWLAGSPTPAAHRLQAVLDDHPTDALSMKLIQAIHFVMGRPAEMRKSAEAVLPKWKEHPALGYLLGCHAFALEETGEYAAAEKAGRAGVELAPQDAWGLHAVAHVYDMTARAKDCLTWLDGRETSWAHCNNFRYHVWWHKALIHLDLGDFDQALAHYDRDIRADKTDDYRDIANATSLLSRLEMEGIDVGHRWAELADLCEKRTNDGSLAFADLHYMLALCGGRRRDAIVRMIARMANAKETVCESQRIITHPGHCMAVGLQTFSSGEYASAWLQLRDARADLQQIGGSHAQRDVFQRICIEAAIRGGYLDTARSLLDERTAMRGHSQDGYTTRRLALIDQVATVVV